ncbi:hypothetical protein PaeBR_20940 [Paenibacillus sp. BR2-3]|uniref:hypothetical protein n=1 Tax=Paenibacillus sp. BR2-3 TaxID=3048494 RepID=UPI0039777B2C
MNQFMQVEDIVKRYFDNAVIIDDQMNFEEIILPELTDQDLGELPDDLVIGQVAVTEESDLDSRPQKLLQQLTLDGFIAYPYKYSTQDVGVQMQFLSKVLNTSKLLFVDWNLEGYKPESPDKPGKAAIEILNYYADQLVGLKCAVIYTQENSKEVLDAVTAHFDVIDQENFFFQEKGKTEGNSLFGFIIRKNTEPREIVEMISKILLKDKCIPIHIMDSASRLENSITKAIHKFNAPFEKVLLTQILSSDIKNEGIPKFLDDTLLSNILSDESSYKASNLLFSIKKQKIMEKLNSDSINLAVMKKFCEVVNLKGKEVVENLFRNSAFLVELKKAINDSEVDTFEKLKLSVISISPDQALNTKINEFILALVLVVDFIDDEALFKQSFLEQTYYFTKLIKYIEITGDNIHTGSIYKILDKDKYLLCITPFCDTHRPSTKVENIFKFIVGKLIEPNKASLKNDSENSCCTGVPFTSDKAVKFIKWDFYNVVSLEVDEVARTTEKVATLRKDYIQNIINRYIAYQARAGVNELFYKETFRETFYGIF